MIGRLEDRCLKNCIIEEKFSEERMNTDQLFTKQSGAEPAKSLSLIPQQHSFVMFYIVCLQTEDSDAMKRAVTKVVRAYDRMDPEFAESQFFSDILIFARNKIVESDGSDVYGDMNVVYEYINMNALSSDAGNEAESSNDEPNRDDVDETMEAIRKQIQDLRVSNFDH